MPPRQVAAYSTDEQIPNSIKEVTAYSTPQDGSDVEKLRAELAEMKKNGFWLRALEVRFKFLFINFNNK